MSNVMTLVRQTLALEQECCYRNDGFTQETQPGTTSRITIALEREVGTPAETIARKLGDRLGWPAYDHELVERIAADLHRPLRMLEALDRQPHGWFLECLASFGTPDGVSVNLYAHRLARLVRSLAQTGKCIIVGRGAAQILPAVSTLRVHLVGTWEDRVQAIGQEFHLDDRAAARKVAELSRAQAQFVSDHFRADPIASGRYDLALNTSHLTADQCVSLIVQALRNKEA